MPEDKPKVLVITSIPPRKPTDTPGDSWADLYEVIGPNHRKYCEKWGYDYHVDVSDIWEQVRPTKVGEPVGKAIPIRYKIKFLLFQHFLDPDSCKKEYDQVVWVDSDCFFTNFDIPLEKFFNGKLAKDGIGEDGRGFVGDIQLTWDVNGLHATVIMMRRSAQTLGYAYANGEAGMRYWITDDWSDMMSQRMFLATPPYQGLIWYHSIQEICAMPPGIYTQIPERARKIYEWTPESLCMHLSALSKRKRIELASHYIRELNL